MKTSESADEYPRGNTTEFGRSLRTRELIDTLVYRSGLPAAIQPHLIYDMRR